MDGKTLLYRLRNILNEDSSSGFLDDRTSYQYIWDAVNSFIEKTDLLYSSKVITTVADQTDYTLGTDYIKMFLKNSSNNFIAKYNDGTNDSFITFKSYNEIKLANNTTSIRYPSNFTIVNKGSTAATLSSFATSTASSGLLVDSGGDFTVVNIGDSVHNLNDNSDGIVISKISSTSITTALFNGTNNYWTSGDTYTIPISSTYTLILDPPPTTSGDTLTLEYVKRADPVFSDYGTYPIPANDMEAIIKYAAFNYKYRESQPNFGDALYRHYDLALRQHYKTMRRSLGRGGFRINFKKRF